MLGEHSKREPPDPIPNSEVKPLSADDSVAVCHVKVGHRQALKSKALSTKVLRAFFMLDVLASDAFMARKRHAYFNELCLIYDKVAQSNLLG